MRLLATAIPVLLIALTSLALENNNPEQWISPNKKYAIKEAFYGEGKRIVAVFVNLRTSHSTVIKGGGARNSSALWSSDSHYVAINFERSHNWGDAAVCGVERGRVSEIKQIALDGHSRAIQHMDIADSRCDERPNQALQPTAGPRDAQVLIL